MQEKNASALKKRQSPVDRIRDRITAIDHVCSGTIVTIMNTCGKPNCRCASDPSARHGPYYQWNRMKKGKLIHRTVTRQQAACLRKAIRNYRNIKRLLRLWEEETARSLDVRHRPK